MDSEKVNLIKKFIDSLDVSLGEKSHLFQEIDRLKKHAARSEFKFKRTLKDKETVTNILNETIKRLKEKSEALTIQAQKLEEQSQYKEQLFANVSHELRTPLHGILGMGHLLEKTPLNVVQNGYVNIVKCSADNLLVIVNDILSLSEINAGKMKIKEEPFSLKKLLEDMEGMLQVRAEQKGLKLSFHIDADVPEYVVSDRTRIYQIFLNLLNNSIKFTHRGYIQLSAKLVYQEGSEARLEVTVEDTGIGMKKEKLASIFESFTRVHEDKGVVYEGAGLGLNIIKNLMHLLKGSIEVDSELGKGTTFNLQIPFQIPDAATVNELNQEDNEEVPEEWTHLKFLMIEDNTANILYAKDIFASWDLELDIATNLADAKKFLTRPYDCILSDVVLPDGNGMEFITELRKDSQAINYSTPVIILTASANEKGASQAKLANVESYLSKPFPPKSLINEFHRILKMETTTTKTLTNGQQAADQENFPKASFTVKPKMNATSAGCPDSFLETLSKRFKGRTSLMVEMAKIFLDQAPVMLKILKSSNNKDDFEAIRFESHKFKSTVNIVGLTSLREFATKTEMIYHDGEPTEDTTILRQQFMEQIELDSQKVRSAIEEMKAEVR